ncbi:MAG: hypothetical protein ACRBFS_16990 [Aureispira sp.]
MSVYVGRWDCKSCGHKGILGPETECSSCGSDRPKDVQFYMVDASEQVQEDRVLKQARAGADWRCSYCGQNNAATTTICKDCGNTKADGDATLAVRTYDAEEVPVSGKKAKRSEEEKNSPPQKKSKRGCGIAALVGLIIIGVLFYFGRSKEILVTVEGFSWERNIATEQERLVEEEDWKVPNRGNQLKSFRAIHHYDQILDHYETRTRTKKRATGTERYVCGKRDLGNGYFEDKYCDRTLYESYEEQYEEPIYRKEPVYKTKYRYSIYRWQKAPPLTTEGSDHNPQWPNTRAIEQDPRRRTTKQSGNYSITVRDDEGQVHAHTIPFEKWQPLQQGQQLKAKRGAATGKYRGLDKEYDFPS